MLTYLLFLLMFNLQISRFACFFFLAKDPNNSSYIYTGDITLLFFCTLLACRISLFFLYATSFLQFYKYGVSHKHCSEHKLCILLIVLFLDF
jgi:hypothetical protein